MSRSTASLSLQISPQFLTKGGKILIKLPFENDPFAYHPLDFTINGVPIKSIYNTNRSFYGEVHSLPNNKDPVLFVRNPGSEEILQLLLQTPSMVIGGFHQLENSIFVTSTGELVFLDIQKSNNRKEEQYIPVLCRYNQQTRKLTSSVLPDFGINAIFVDKFDRIFASSIQEKALFLIKDDLQFSTHARGLGAPFGMIANKDNELFMADQKGSLFRIEDHHAIFLGDIPPSMKGYYLCVCPQTQDIFISTPSYLGENTIMVFEQKTQKLKPKLVTYNLIGPIGFDFNQNFYWVENTREESILYRQHKNKKPEKILSGQFFTGLSFAENGDMYINDLHTVYKIHKDKLYEY